MEGWKMRVDPQINRKFEEKTNERVELHDRKKEDKIWTLKAQYKKAHSNQEGKGIKRIVRKRNKVTKYQVENGILNTFLRGKEKSESSKHA